MTARNHTCQGCGKDINIETKTCPHCGYRESQKSEGSAAIKKGQELYRGDRERGVGHHSEDIRRRKLDSGPSSIHEAVKRGGISGNVQVCMKCKHVQSKVSDNCESCGAKLKR